MASPLLPSTPRLSSVRTLDTPSPGKWRHPHLKEIVKRQNAARFSDKNMRKILWNGGTLVASGFFGSIFKQYSLALGSLIEIPTYPDAILLFLRLFLLANVMSALYPLFRPKDEISDIPLTPSQRALLGLDPGSSTPVTPGSTYVTPPRYRLSSGSRRASSSSPNASPLSGKGSSSGKQYYDNSPFSPSPSPLFQRAVGGGNRDSLSRDSLRRHSFGSPSPLGRSSLRDSVLRSPSTPSPPGGKHANVLANKWLYEKSRGVSPGGSVFR